MAVSNTTRFSLPQWGAGTDLHPGRTGWNNILLLLEQQAAIAYPSGAIGDRPRGGTFGRFYLATDQGEGGRLYYDGGSGWIELNTNGGGGAGQPITITGTASEGNSNRSARADHTHKMALATSSAHGAMPSQDKALLDTATHAATPDALVKRNGNRQIEVGNPGVNAHAVNLGYLNSRLSDSPDATHQAIGGTIMRRTGSGTVHVNTGTNGTDAANKDYVDGKYWDGSRINTGHVHHAHIYGSSLAFSRTASTTSSYGTCMIASDGRFWRYTSAIKYKDQVTPWGLTLAECLAPEGVEYIDKETGQHRVGIVADGHAGGPLDKLVQYGEDGEVEGWHYFLMPVVHQVALRHLSQKATQLEDENARLKSRLTRIEEHLGI